jgi:hypothetical protein
VPAKNSSAASSRRNLVLENLALRHQLAVLNRTAKHEPLSNADRFFWADSSAGGTVGRTRS